MDTFKTWLENQTLCEMGRLVSHPKWDIEGEWAPDYYKLNFLDVKPPQEVFRSQMRKIMDHYGFEGSPGIRESIDSFLDFVAGEETRLRGNESTPLTADDVKKASMVKGRGTLLSANFGGQLGEVQDGSCLPRLTKFELVKGMGGRGPLSIEFEGENQLYNVKVLGDFSIYDILTTIPGKTKQPWPGETPEGLVEKIPTIIDSDLPKKMAHHIASQLSMWRSKGLESDVGKNQFLATPELLCFETVTKGGSQKTFSFKGASALAPYIWYRLKQKAEGETEEPEESKFAVPDEVDLTGFDL